MTASPCTLLTFAPMIDSALSRLVLGHHGIVWREECHLFGYVSLLALKRGGTVQVPLLTGCGAALAGPRAIAEHFDAAPDGASPLLPDREPWRSEIEADWTRFNGRLASSVAVFTYFHLLPARGPMVESFAGSVPPAEARALGRWAYPVIRWLLATLLDLSSSKAADSWNAIGGAMDETDRRIADGRPWLAGDAISLADLALAAALAPVVIPDGYGRMLPPIAELPPTMSDAVRQCRRRPTAALVARVFTACRQDAVTLPAD
jgi:glutathione S-transferase